MRRNNKNNCYPMSLHRLRGIPQRYKTVSHRIYAYRIIYNTKSKRATRYPARFTRCDKRFITAMRNMQKNLWNREKYVRLKYTTTFLSINSVSCYIYPIFITSNKIFQEMRHKYKRQRKTILQTCVHCYTWLHAFLNWRIYKVNL